jgi:LuxR family maltose regulon positive regulatory protein
MPYLLRTKTALPPRRSQHIRRDRLLQQLNDTAGRPATPLILVSSPAGFGKSDFLASWSHLVQQNGVRVAWVSLDEQDNDPARFVAYVLQAFRGIDDEFGVLPAPDESVDMQEAFNQIINVVAEVGQPVVLVLDDYHLITTPAIHDAVSRLCEYLPFTMHLAIGSRADPPLQLARLRARGEVSEIRMADLRFTTAELLQWFQSAVGWTPSEQVTGQLEDLTEGWAAALSLIITMLNKPQVQPTDSVLAKQLARYSQTQRHIFDYFAEEVLEQQPREITEFLLNTSVLNRLHPDPSRALTGNTDTARLLNQIATENLFIIPLSDEAPVYRHHHLFRQFLRRYLELKDRAHYLEQHRQAAEWYAGQDDIVEAVHHALTSEDYGYAARLIEGRAWEVLTSRGEIMTVLSWLPRFPESTLRDRPRLALYFSRGLYLVGDIEQSRTLVTFVAETLDERGSEVSESETLQAITANYQATLAAYQGNIEEALGWNARAVELSEAVEGQDRVRIANTDAHLHYLRGDIPAARRAYEHALALAEGIHHHYLTLDAHYYLAQLDLKAGDLQAVQDRAEMLLKAYPTQFGPLSTIMLPLSMVLYQRNQVVEAEVGLREAIALARRANIPDVLWYAHLMLAGILLLRGQVTDAEANISQARRLAQGFSSPMMASFIGAAEARIMLHSGQVDAALDWAAHYQQTEQGGYHQDYENLTLAQIWITEGQPSTALPLLAQVIEAAAPAGRISSIISAQVLQTLAYQASGDMDAALAALGRALELAQPQGFVRVFLDAGQPMLRMLQVAVEGEVVTNYTKHLLEIAQATSTATHPADLLTEREIEVLEHIAAGASNQDIADTLFISVGTIKSHIHRLMSKLDAQNRTEAVSKARRLNILPD